VIIGKPGRGKTTALNYYVAILLKAGAEVHVWDPHGSLSELAGTFERLHYTDDLSDIPESVTALTRELEARRLLYKQSRERIKEVKRSLLLLVDELPVIAQYGRTHKDIPALIEKFVLEARKWNCYFIGAGQSTDAEILPTRVSDNLSSRIVLYSSNRRTGMAGIDIEVAHRFLPLLKPDEVKGRMLFDCSRMSEPVLGAIPWIEVKDLAAFLGPMMMPPPKEQTAALPTGAQPKAQPGGKQEGAVPVKIEDLTVEQLLALVQRLPEVDPTDSRYKGQPPVVQVTPPSDEMEQLSPEAVDRQRQESVRQAASDPHLVRKYKAGRYDKALQAWNAGYHTVRTLAQHIGVTESVAYGLMKDMDTLGLIQMKKRT
jgi:hypothetical protein